MFPGGINVKDDVGVTAYFKSYTNYLLNRDYISTIYEATIIEKNVLVMCVCVGKRQQRDDRYL